MERKKASDFPQELLDLFDHYVHGDIDRRAISGRREKVRRRPALRLRRIWESLRPNYAWAQQVPKDDSRIKAEYETVASPEGNGSIKGYLVRPANAAGKLPGVLVVHENRGLNPYIEDVARRLATANFMAFAPDGLTSVGGYPGDEEKGAALFRQVDKPKMTEDFMASAHWLKARPDCTGKIGVVGFCFGGGIVNTLAVRLGSDLAAGGRRSTARSRRRRTSRRSKRRCCCTTARSTRASPAGWPAYEEALKANHVTYTGLRVRGRQSRLPQRHHAAL